MTEEDESTVLLQGTLRRAFFAMKKGLRVFFLHAIVRVIPVRGFFVSEGLKKALVSIIIIIIVYGIRGYFLSLQG